jgi:hypothetical protein
MGRIPPEQPQNSFFFQHYNLSRIAVFSKPVVVKKVIKPKPLIRWRQVNTRWKPGGVLYLFGIWLSTEFQIEQHQISIYWLLLTVKIESTSLSDFIVRRWCWWIEHSDSLRALKSYATTHNLATYQRILFAMAFSCDYVSEQKFWTKSPLWQISFLWILRDSRSKTCDLPFDQVILMLYLVSRILAQSTKISRHCITTFMYCTIPYASSHKCVYNHEQESKYLMQY